MLADRLGDLLAAQSAARIDQATPHAWEPGITYRPDGSAVVTSGPVEATRAPESVLADLGVAVPPTSHARLVEARYDPLAWSRDGQGQQATTQPVVRLRWVIEPAVQHIPVDDLLAAIGKKRPTPSPATGQGCFVVAVADTQLGDGETEAVVDRVQQATFRALDRLKILRKRHAVNQVCLTWLGDCIQGTVTAAPRERNDLSLVDMIRVYRRLLLWQVQQFADNHVTVAVVPGNHDQVARAGRAEVYPSDKSWAVEGAVQVADALALAGRFEHVQFVHPAPNQSTITIDLAGTVVGLAHGHQWRGPASAIHKWWAGQSHGRTGVGAADVLLTGHRHHFYAETAGLNRLAVVAPPMVSASHYWTDAHGDQTHPGLLTMMVGGGTWWGLEIL